MTKKILVVRYRFIGDTVLTVPFLRNLRRAYPNARIDMLVAPVSGEVIENCPYVDNFIYFDTTRKHKYENKNLKKPTSFWSYVRFLEDQKYDKAYVLKRSFSSAALVFLAGIKERIGFNTEGRGFLLTKRVKYPNDRHEIECFLDVLRADGIEVKDNYLENWVNAEEALAVELVLKQCGVVPGKKRVVLHATATNKGKLWPKEYFAKVLSYLVEEKGAQVLYLGTESDRAAYEEIESILFHKLGIKPVNLCGKLNLKQSLAVIAMSDLLIGNDSGNLHMAASVQTPVIGIYGPMNIQKWYAYGKDNVCLKSNLDCMPCGLKGDCERDYACLKSIKPSDVIKAIDKFL